MLLSSLSLVSSRVLSTSSSTSTRRRRSNTSQAVARFVCSCLVRGCPCVRWYVQTHFATMGSSDESRVNILTCANSLSPSLFYSLPIYSPPPSWASNNPIHFFLWHQFHYSLLSAAKVGYQFLQPFENSEPPLRGNMGLCYLFAVVASFSGICKWQGLASGELGKARVYYIIEGGEVKENGTQRHR